MQRSTSVDRLRHHYSMSMRLNYPMVRPLGFRSEFLVILLAQYWLRPVDVLGITHGSSVPVHYVELHIPGQIQVENRKSTPLDCARRRAWETVRVAAMLS